MREVADMTEQASMRMIIDRFENGFAVVELEDGTVQDVPRSILPVDANEGDSVLVTIDLSSVAERGERIEALMDTVWETGEDS